MYRAALFGAALIAAVAGPAMAQDATPSPCSTEEYRQLDFWVGTWDVSWVDQEGNTQHGTNTISRELDTCMIFEEFDAGAAMGFVGRSMSMYVGRSGTWKQLWMDNSGGYLPFTGGPDEAGFKLVMDRASDQAPHLRMIFRNITENGLDWHWQTSADGGETWEDSWHIMYSRH